MTIPRQSYSDNEFVHRPDIVEKLKNDFETLNTQMSSSTVIIEGHKGAGKSWLALHLHRDNNWKPSGAHSYLIKLDGSCDELSKTETLRGNEHTPDKQIISNEFCDDVRKLDSKQVTEEILRWLLRFMSEMPLPVQADAGQLAYWLSRDGRAVAERSPLVFIFDGIFEADNSFLAQLEERLLMTLISWPRCMIIMMSQGEPYNWTSSQLRAPRSNLPSTDKAVLYKLDAFTVNQTQEQLSNLNSTEDAGVIHEIGAGAPLNTLLLSRYNKDAKDWVKSLDQLINALLEENGAHELRIAFEALSVLKDFNEAIMRPILQEASKKPQEWTGSLLSLRQKLVKSGLVRWKADSYEMDESIRKPIEEYLRRGNLELWKQLHERALKEYRAWAGRFPGVADEFNARADYHQEALNTPRDQPSASADPIQPSNNASDFPSDTISTAKSRTTGAPKENAVR